MITNNIIANIHSIIINRSNLIYSGIMWTHNSIM